MIVIVSVAPIKKKKLRSKENRKSTSISTLRITSLTMSSLLTVVSDSSDDEASDDDIADYAGDEAASASLVEEEIPPSTLKDKLVLRLTSYTSSILDIKRAYVSDLMQAFNDKTLHLQLPTYLREALTETLTPHTATTGPNALKNICKW